MKKNILAIIVVLVIGAAVFTIIDNSQSYFYWLWHLCRLFVVCLIARFAIMLIWNR